MATSFRPLSPHLQIWRFTLTMTLSIVHRITGMGLYVGMVLLDGWLAAAAWGPDALASAHGFFGHWLIQIVLFAYTWTLFHHMAGGVRYFIWDTGSGMGSPARHAIALATLVFSLSMTFVMWAIFVWS